MSVGGRVKGPVERTPEERKADEAPQNSVHPHGEDHSPARRSMRGLGVGIEYEAEGLNETPQVPAGGTVDVTVYSGPFPASFDLHNLRLLIDAGTSSVAVIELP
jgi:hypothetical protein